MAPVRHADTRHRPVCGFVPPSPPPVAMPLTDVAVVPCGSQCRGGGGASGGFGGGCGGGGWGGGGVVGGWTPPQVPGRARPAGPGRGRGRRQSGSPAPGSPARGGI